MPRVYAEAFAEMYAAAAAGRLTPKGDRMVQGTTRIDEILARLARA